MIHTMERTEKFFMNFINIGYGNMVSKNRVIAIISPDSAPIKRIVQENRDKGRVIDATCGKRTRAVIIMDSGHIVLSPILPETISSRFNDKEDITENE